MHCLGWEYEGLRFFWGDEKLYTQLFGDVIKPFWGSLLNNQYFMECICFFCFVAHLPSLKLRTKNLLTIGHPKRKCHLLEPLIFRGELFVSGSVNTWWLNWWKKSYISWYGRYLIIYRVSYILGGTGFLPSTVCLQIFADIQILHIDIFWAQGFL